VAEWQAFADLVSSGFLEVGDGYRAKLDELTGGGSVFLRAGALGDDGFDWDGLDEFGPDARVHSKEGQPSDVVITTKGNSIGRVGFVPLDAPKFVYSPHLSYWRSKDQTKVVSRFLYYWSRSEAFWTQLRQVGFGTDMAPYLSLKDQLSLRIWLPNVTEQRAIANVLGALDDKIAANTKLAATADELGLSLVRREIATGQADEVPLSSMADIVMGSSPKGDAINDVGEGVVFHQGIRDFGLRTPTTRLWTTAPTRVADSGDILVSVRAPVGEVNVASSPLCIGRGLAAVKSVDGRSATLLGVMRASRDVWEPFNSEGTVFGSINRAQLHDVRLPRVRAEVAEGLEDALASLEETIRSIEVTNVQLSAVRDALLPALMSGRLTVADL
jgi:type I restriction enzyme S subunit